MGKRAAMKRGNKSRGEGRGGGEEGGGGGMMDDAVG